MAKKKKITPTVKNPLVGVLRSSLYKKRIEKNKKGKASYSRKRKGFKISKDLEPFSCFILYNIQRTG